MKNVFKTFAARAACAGTLLWALGGLCSCSSDDGKNVAGGGEEETGIVAVKNWDVAGVSQKGPFVTGSAVTVQELDGVTLNQSGKSFKGSIKSDKGDFSITGIDLASQYAMLEASGYYRDEISGKKSAGMVTLKAITDLSNRKQVNVNLLTHLEYERVMYLVTKKNMSVAKAKKQADEEILAAFSMNETSEQFEDLNIFETGDGNAALLAVSVLLQSNVDAAGLTERMGNLAIALSEDGAWDDVDTKAEIADWACDADLRGALTDIRENVESWKYSDTVPNFEKYVANFWWDNYGLGACTDKREGDLKRNLNKLSKRYDEYFTCEGGRWVIPSEVKSSSSGASNEKSSSSNGDATLESSSSMESSSSVYNPFDPVVVSPEDTLPKLPSALSFLDEDTTVKRRSYMEMGDGQQKVWFMESKHFVYYETQSRDSLGSILVKELIDHGFSYEGAVKNDSLAPTSSYYGLTYSDSSYTYVMAVGGYTYRIAFTQAIYLYGVMSGGYCYIDLKIVVLKDGFEELPSEDRTSLRYSKAVSPELEFLDEFRGDDSWRGHGWDDDSLLDYWEFSHRVVSVEDPREELDLDPEKELLVEQSLDSLRESLAARGWTLAKKDTVVEKFEIRKMMPGDDLKSTDSLEVFEYYEKETDMARYTLIAVGGAYTNFCMACITTDVYEYAVGVRIYYKKNPLKD